MLLVEATSVGTSCLYFVGFELDRRFLSVSRQLQLQYDQSSYQMALHSPKRSSGIDNDQIAV